MLMMTSMKKKILLLFVFITSLTSLFAFNGLDLNVMGNLSKISDAQTRCITAENPTGEKAGGAKAEALPYIRNVSNSSRPASKLGKGWKVNPYMVIAGGETLTIADIKGSGAIQYIWFAPMGSWRRIIIRMYWDDEKTPSVEVPLGDFFCMAYSDYAQISSFAVCVNPGRGFNCYWKMPFRKAAKITIENRHEREIRLYYQINYALTKVDDNEAYFHAQFRQSVPTKGSLHTILDGVKGRGHYVGTYFAWRTNNDGWWGEGEMKFYLDGDKEYPTICGTGLEDYVGAAYNFHRKGRYVDYTTPYSGMPQVIAPNGLYKPAYFGLYRWHITDPIRFNSDLRITVQDLGWNKDWEYLQQKSDISTVAYWYQTEPHAPFPKLPTNGELVINKQAREKELKQEAEKTSK